MLDISVRVFSSIIAHAAAVIFIYAIFKLDIKNNHRQIAILSLVMGGVYYVVRFGMESKLYFPMTAMALILGLMVIRNYPFFFAFIIGGLGYFMVGILDEVITFGIMGSLGMTLQQLIDSTTWYVLSQLLAMIFLIALSGLLVRKKWGFEFIVRRFRNKRWILKPHNFIWAFTMLAGMITIQVTILRVNTYSFPWVFLLVLIVGFIIALIITSRENQKVYKDLKRIVKGVDEDFKLY